MQASNQAGTPEQQKSEIHLVTGGCGFIGSHLVDKLLSIGKNVRILDNLSNGLDRGIHHMCLGDIRNPIDVAYAMKGVTHVYHLAAIGSVPRSWSAPELTFGVNVTGTINVLKEAVRNGVQRFIFASSSSVYGSQGGVPRVESSNVEPESPYALSKHTGEKLCRLYFIQHGLPVTILRFFNVFGARQRPDTEYAAAIPRFITNILKGTPSTLYSMGTCTRDFTPVDTVVSAVVAATKLNTFNTINVASGAELSIYDVYKTLQNIIGKEVKPILTPAMRPGEIQRSYADVTLMRELLGIRPQSLRDAFEETIETYKSKS